MISEQLSNCVSHLFHLRLLLLPLFYERKRLRGFLKAVDATQSTTRTKGSILESSFKSVEVIISQHLVVSVVFSEHLQVMNIVFICFYIQSQVLSHQFAHFAQVDIVSQIVTFKMSLFLSVLRKSFLKLFKRLDSIKDINVFWFHIIGFHSFNVLLNTCGSKSSICFSLNSFLAFDSIDFFLEHCFILKLLVF